MLLKWNLLTIWINIRMVFMTKYHEVIVYFVHMVWINLKKKFKKVFWVSKIIFYTGLSHSSGPSHLCCLLPLLPRFLPTVQWAVQGRSSQSSLQLDCRWTSCLQCVQYCSNCSIIIGIHVNLWNIGLVQYVSCC